MPDAISAVVETELAKPLLTPGETAARTETVTLKAAESGMVAREAATMKPLRLGPFSVTKDPDHGDKGLRIFADADPHVGSEGQDKVQGAVIRIVSASGDALLVVIAKEAAPPVTDKPEEAAPTPLASESLLSADAQQTMSDLSKEAQLVEVK
jgi:hypothetical protein